MLKYVFIIYVSVLVELRNRFKIFDSNGQQVLYAIEGRIHDTLL